MQNWVLGVVSLYTSWTLFLETWYINIVGEVKFNVKYG